MPNITDSELITRLLQATEDGRITWERTDVKDQFAAKFAGKWTLTVDRDSTPPHEPDDYWLTLSNSGGEEILKIYSNTEEQVDRLFEGARRRALHIDEALSEVLAEISGPQISDEDIPF